MGKRRRDNELREVRMKTGLEEHDKQRGGRKGGGDPG